MERPIEFDERERLSEVRDETRTLLRRESSLLFHLGCRVAEGADATSLQTELHAVRNRVEALLAAELVLDV